MALHLRPYQQECVDIINALEGGSHLVHMATGLGKTVVFTSIKRRGRVLIISHRDELVRQPVKYYDVPVGIEKGAEHSQGEPVVSATVQTLSRDKRLAAFTPGEFDTIITDEAHHALAPSYRKVVETLKPRLHVGFTATPRRGDDRGLEKVFDDIVFSRDLKWGIGNGYLADLDCRRVYVAWDTSRLRRKNGDYAVSDLDGEVNQPRTNDQIAEAYRQFAEGPTLVFASSVEHAHQLARRIKNAAVVDGKMPLSERRRVIEEFSAGTIACLVNFGVFTEGTDLPMIRTVLLARPTQNPTLYAQMVGRGLRLDEEHGKTSVRLIDCVGITKDHRLCTAPTLFGLNEDDFPEGAARVLDGPLSGLQSRLMELEDTPTGWVLRARRVNILEGGVAWTPMVDGSRVVRGERFSVVKSAPDDLGGVDVRFSGMQSSMFHFANEEEADRRVLDWLSRNPLTRDERHLWDSALVKRWGQERATTSQLDYIKRLVGEGSEEVLALGLSKRDAATVIENAQSRIEQKDAEALGRCPLCGSALKLSQSGKTVQCSRLRWKREGTEYAAAGACTFRFVRKLGRIQLADREVKRLVSEGRIVVRGRCLTLAEADEPGLYELAENRSVPSRRRFKPWRDPEVRTLDGGVAIAYVQEIHGFDLG